MRLEGDAMQQDTSQRCCLDGLSHRVCFIAAHSLRVRRLSAALTSHNFTTCHAETSSLRPTLLGRSERRLQHNQEWSRYPLESNYPQKGDFIPKRIEQNQLHTRRFRAALV